MIFPSVQNFDEYFFHLVYAEFEGDECNSLDFQLGTNAIDATLPTNRGWNIKVLFNSNSYKFH